MNNLVGNMLNEAHKPKEPLPMQSMVMDGVVMDSANASSAYEMGALKLEVASALQEFAETDDLDSGESLCDRFWALLCGLADQNKDGELSDEESKLVDTAYNLAAQYLYDKGIEEDQIIAFLQDDDEEAAESIQEYLKNILPDGEDNTDDDLNAFAFGDGSDEPVFDAAYRKVKAVRNGKKVVIRKRVSGHVRLSARQKMALQKAHRKAHNGRARMKRLKSMKKRQKLGL